MWFSFPYYLDESYHGIWSDGETLWVAETKRSQVRAYDLDSGDRLSDKDFTTLAAAGNHKPWGIWSDGDTMWVADSSANKIFAYDLYTCERRRALEFNTLAAAGNTSPRGLWSDGTTLWIAGTRRVDGRNDQWQLTINPQTGTDITVTLDADAACGTAQAACTSDNTPLANTATAIGHN